MDVNIVFDRKRHPKQGKALGAMACDAVKLLGEINYPNLSFNIDKGDFGCVLNDMSK